MATNYGDYSPNNEDDNDSAWHSAKSSGDDVSEELERLHAALERKISFRDLLLDDETSHPSSFLSRSTAGSRNAAVSSSNRPSSSSDLPFASLAGSGIRFRARKKPSSSSAARLSSSSSPIEPPLPTMRSPPPFQRLYSPKTATAACVSSSSSASVPSMASVSDVSSTMSDRHDPPSVAFVAGQRQRHDHHREKTTGARKTRVRSRTKTTDSDCKPSDDVIDLSGEPVLDAMRSALETPKRQCSSRNPNVPPPENEEFQRTTLHRMRRLERENEELRARLDQLNSLEQENHTLRKQLSRRQHEAMPENHRSERLHDAAVTESGLHGFTPPPMPVKQSLTPAEQMEELRLQSRKKFHRHAGGSKQGFSPGTVFVAELAKDVQLGVGHHAALSMMIDKHWDRLSAHTDYDQDMQDSQSRHLKN